MELFYSALSPFARKVRVCAYELGLHDRLVLVPTDTWTDPTYRQTNPLSQVPALALDDGEVLFDSAVICEALIEMGGGGLVPPAGRPRWTALTRQALADGMADAGVRIVRERQRSDPHDDVVAGQTGKIVAGLAVLEPQAPFADFGLAEIAVACLLGYLDARKILDWREGRPLLAAWFETVSRRDSMVASLPQIAKS